MKIHRLLLIVVALLTLTGCDQLVAQFVDADNFDLLHDLKIQKEHEIQVEKVTFAPDHRTFSITTKMLSDIGPYSLMDSSKVRIEVDKKVEGLLNGQRSMPRLIRMRNVKADNIAKSGIKVLVLVDATLPQTTLNQIRDYVVELRAVFNHNNLFLSFMQGDQASESLPASDYVLDNYFKKAQADSVLLYRLILQKKDELMARQGVWADAKRMALLTFSNGKMYDDATNTPFDVNHYQYEEQLLAPTDTLADFMACYADMSPLRSSADNHEAVVLRHFCESTHGLFMQPYSGTDFKNNVLKVFHVGTDANEFVFENPKGKVYRGNLELLTVNFYDTATDSLITSFTTTIHEGSIYNPIVVCGNSIAVIITRGIILGGFIMLFAWLLLQFVVPYISYRIFLKKYVVCYTGANMGMGTTAVQQSCYLCKEPFKTGDQIVVKCEHTMHKSCWDENNYHCPEYSDRCKKGTHYYNHHDLTDAHNASFYLRWILMSIVAAMLAWLVFIIREHAVDEYIVSMVIPVEYISPLSSFGFSIGFFLTLGISYMSSRPGSLGHRIAGILGRSIIAAIGCYLAFFLTNFIIVVSNLGIIEMFVEWVPWTLSAIIIAVCATFHTRIRLRKRLILPGIVFGILTVYVWWLFFDSEVDFRVFILFSFIIYALGLAASVATLAPRSERYFLKVEGAIKEMDIALYKWFRNAPDRVVTIGKSVDCTLQLSWDMMGSVAPVNAQICMSQGALCLIALEEGVYAGGKPVQLDKKIWLYHGKKFTIGNTTFTYVEKDL